MASEPLPGVNVLIEGPTGTGKTFSVGTLVDTGVHVHVLLFEAGGESLRGYWLDEFLLNGAKNPRYGKGLPSNLHITTVKQSAASWKEMADAAKLVNTLSYESLKKSSDPNRSRYDQFEKFLRAFNDVTDDEGNKYGSIDEWGTDRALVIDGMTGLGNSAMASVIGGKVDKDQKDWGLAQNLVENTIRRLCDNCRCHFILLAHVDREADPLGGASKITISTLGAKLAPKIPAMFSDVAMSVKLGREFFWDTENALADLKVRNLPIAAKIKPDFAAIIEKWKTRGGVIASAAPT